MTIWGRIRAWYRSSGDMYFTILLAIIVVLVAWLTFGYTGN